ncbi:MAG: lipopolysaccharide kinase InaA family protein, partial [Candidatus Brocadiales bacterium]|nr:lipopolysaccharide kinase InaA family protein [Candidatus Brocadiales bacterium]
MFKGYISNTIGHVHWTIHAQSSFLIPYLERISDKISGEFKESTDDTLLTVIRKDRYKILGEFEVTHANTVQTYLVKIYKYPNLIQKIKQLFKNTRGFREFNTTYISAMKGIPVEVPVAYGEGRRLFTKKSYLIIRKIKHASTLREFFKSSVVFKERRDVLKKFGKLAKIIHDSGVKQDDFSLDNFLVYNDENSERRLILIDFERVSIQTKFLSEKQRVWYLAKLNRAKKYFTNTERLRFLLSYAEGNFDYCKRLARQIEAVTVHIQKKDAKKFYKQCIHKNRKFVIFKNTKYYGYYRRDYSPETLLPLLDTIRGTPQKVCYINNFRIACFTEHGNTTQNYRNLKRTWMHANALFALRIDVPVPVGVFTGYAAKLSNERFLISQMPENCIPLDQYDNLHSDKTPILCA